MAGYLPEFIPAEAPTAGLQLINQTVDTVSSAMDRTQRRNIEYKRMKMEREEANRKQQEFNTKKPLMEAQTKNGMAQLENEHAAGLQMSEMYQSANAEMPEIRESWIGASGIDDPRERVNAMTGVLGRAGKFSSLTGIGEEIKGWQNVYAKQAIDLRTLEGIRGSLDKQGLQNQGRLDVAQANAQASADRDAARLAERDRRAQELALIKNPEDILRRVSEIEDGAYQMQLAGNTKDYDTEMGIAKALRGRASMLSTQRSAGGSGSGGLAAALAAARANKSGAATVVNEATPGSRSPEAVAADEADARRRRVDGAARAEVMQAGAATPVQSVDELLNGLDL